MELLYLDINLHTPLCLSLFKHIPSWQAVAFYQNHICSYVSSIDNRQTSYLTACGRFSADHSSLSFDSAVQSIERNLKSFRLICLISLLLVKPMIGPILTLMKGPFRSYHTRYIKDWGKGQITRNGNITRKSNSSNLII